MIGDMPCRFRDRAIFAVDHFGLDRLYVNLVANRHNLFKAPKIIRVTYMDINNCFPSQPEKTVGDWKIQDALWDVALECVEQKMGRGCCSGQEEELSQETLITSKENLELDQNEK